MNKSRKITSTIALILIATFLISIALPTVSSQTAMKTKKTYAMCGLMPNPVGVGQPVLIWVGITDMLLVYTDGWEGLTVTVTRPDGTTETLGTFRTDSTGSTGTTYTPSMVGTYYFQTHFPEQVFNWTTAAVFDPALFGPIKYLASDSEKKPLIVQEEPIKYYSESTMPTEFWTRPIDAQHREWYTISANWLRIPPNRLALNNDNAPESAHILWAKPLTYGGLAGGLTGEHAFDCGDAYEGKFVNSVIINGILYYNRYATVLFGGGWVQQGIVAVDIRTGEELWFRNNTRLAFGQTLYWDSHNSHSVFSYLWSTASVFNPATFTMTNEWTAYDPFTGEFMYKMTNVPSGSVMFGADMTVIGEKGEFLIYEVNLAAGWMALWNSTKVVNPQNTGQMGDGSWGQLANTQQTFDGKRGYQWNKTIPLGLPGTTIQVLANDKILGTTAGGWTGIGDKPISLWAISIKPGQEGTLLYNTTWQPPAGDLAITWGAASGESNVFTLRAKETRQWWGFDASTGNKIWGPTASEEDLGIYGMNGFIAYGKLYAANKYGGTIYCYNAKTGALIWNYTAVDPYNEILWSNNWPISPVFITDGKIYLGHSEHSPVDPKPRGAPFICLDAETGEEIWRMDGGFRQTDWGGLAVIGDSIIATMNSYDQRIYAIGKGPSATTVTAPDIGVPAGSSVVIRGTVTDISAGTKESAITSRFPNGVPAIADKYMSEWMKYVYMQFNRPTDATGVPVTLDAIDPNGNFIHIGETTSDASGMFSFRWVPPSEIPGHYTVIATFAGSKSYWPSYSQTSMSVDPAAEPTSQASPLQTSIVEAYFIPAVAGLFVAIIFVGALLALMQRKRP